MTREKHDPSSRSSLLFPQSYPGAAGLAEDVRYYGKWMRDEAEKRIGHLYPKVKITEEMAEDRPDLEQYVGQELTVIAWLWARTVQCPNPGCRARAPLVRSFWLSKKRGKSCYAKPVLDRHEKSVRFEIETKGEPPQHTTDRNGGRCLFCETFIKKGPLREIAVQHGVREIPLAIVAEGSRGRVYLGGDALPRPKVPRPDVPFLEQPITNDRRWFSPPLYGMPNFADLFTSRQLVALTTFSDLVQEAREKVLADARIAFEPRSANASQGAALSARGPSVDPRSESAASERAEDTANTVRGSAEPRSENIASTTREPRSANAGSTNADLTTCHITFGAYGTRLHGDERPTVHHRRNRPGEPFEPPDPERVKYIRESMRFEPVYLTDEQRVFIERTVPELCDRGGWTLHQVAAQRDHVHVLLSGAANGKAIRRWLKTWLTQALNDRWPREEWWAKGGSCRIVSDDRYFEAALRYVAKQRTDTANTAGDSPEPPPEPPAEPPSVRADDSVNAAPPSTARGSTVDPPLAAGGAGPTAYADAVATYLAFAIDKCVDYWSTIATWATGGFIRGTFARQALPMTWDFAECNPMSESTANWNASVAWVSTVLNQSVALVNGFSGQRDATAALTGLVSPMVSTDPPYYDNIGYADLSDFFYIWLRRSLKGNYPSLFATALTPKAQELIASPYRNEGSKQKAQEFFETGLGKAFERMHQVHTPDCPLTVYYAFKQAETDDIGAASSARGKESSHTASTGWETMLAGLIRSGFSITGTWPMRTERTVRSVGLGTNALASSIVLVCRARPADAPLATRKEFMNALRAELPVALRNLQYGNVAPVDLAQSAIGPGMAVFTRYSKVMESDGTPMTVRTALGIINQVLDEVLAEQEGDFDADTRWALAWFEQFGTQEGAYGVAETLSKAKNTAVSGLVEAGVIVARGGKVKLLARDELSDSWDPTTEKRLTVWETTQHLIRTLDRRGESATADLMNKLGAMAETARELAYRLYVLCERKKWADEALAYNGLVIVWPELTKLARRSRQGTGDREQRLFEESEGS